MNLKLIRSARNSGGIFGKLLDENDLEVAVTLEHAYQTYAHDWMPKVPRGVYTCQRGPHRLKNMTEDFETFEITGVVGHSNILFHPGNYNDDSEGCVLVGQAVSGNMITESKITFEKFMALQEGVDTFTLAVDP